MAKKLKLGVLASGSGTNLQSIIDACAAGNIDAEVTLVISNNPDAGALQRARDAGLTYTCINHRDFSSREQFDRTVVGALQDAGVELVCLAGFMRLITEDFLAAFPGRVINIHPALLPAFPGLDVQRKAIDYGARFSGCTVHFVDTGVDTGPVIIQAVVPILDDDTPDTLAARILRQEHQVYPRAIQLFAEGRLHIEGRRVRVSESARDDAALINPPLA
ncbi:MAG: phosphoribosylglycinamide formyltransferase [Desulfuromonas sp.]|nr:MAG: phosphoribosylglycinamide formyltransferase [Desulfuromonas sp.]